MTSLHQDIRPVLARGVRLRNDPITGEPVLLFPEGVLPLDETTCAIVSRCNGDCTVEAIIVALAEEYEVEPDTVRQDVSECLGQLRQRMLVALVK
jgi:coenzyme PQQ biosynthesis protein PqqD